MAAEPSPAVRERAEAGLARAFEWHTAIFEGSRDAIFISDPESRFTVVNGAACELTGYSSEELLTMSIPDLHEGIDLHAFQAFHDRILAGDEIVSEAKILRKDGRKVDAEFSNRRVNIGGVTYMHTSARDISERKRAEEELRESREMLRESQAIAGLGSYVEEIATGSWKSSAVLDSVFGIDETYERSVEGWVALIHPDDRAMMVEYFETEVVGKGRTFDKDYRIIRHDNQAVRWVHGLGRLEFDPQGRPLKMRGTIQDITERKRAEEALRESEDRYRDLVEHSQDLICTHDLGGRFLTVNPAAARASGYSIDEILTMNLRDVLAPGVRGQADAYLATVKERGGAKGLMRIVTKSGRPRVWAFDNTLRTEGVTTPVVRGLARDVTDMMQAEDALRQSQRLLATILENVQDAYFRVGLDGKVVMVSPSAPRMYGYTSAQEMIGLTTADLYADPGERESVIEELRRTGRVHDRIGRGRRRDGSEFHVSLNAQFYRDERGAIAGSEGFVRDITERQRAEDLKAAIYEISEAAHQATSLDEIFAAVHRIVGRLMEARNFYIALYDPGTNLLSFPYFVDEVDDRPEPFPAERGMTSHVVRTGQPLLATPEVLREFEERGQIEPLGGASVDWLGVPLKVQGRLIGVLAVQSYTGKVRYSEADAEVLGYVSAQVAQAIERKRAEESLRESEARFRRSIEEFSDGFALIDEQGNVIEWNAALERIHGIKREEALDKPLWDVQWRVYPPERRTPERYEFLKHSILDTVQTGRLPSLPGQIDMLSVDGRRRTVAQNVFAMKTETGFRVGVVIQDITERTELEAQLRQAQKMEAVGSLAGGVAHDFNNLLQALLSQAQLLRTHAHDPERVKALGVELGQQISHGASLTRQLLLFSRRETTRPEPLDLNAAVRAATKMMRRLVRANIALEIELAPEALPVTADRGQFEQVLMNLVVNASDAMPEGGKLTIRTGALDAGHVCLTVQDTGPGIPEAIRERIFEPFFTTKGAGKGTGLGLSVVHGIVTQHGGRIEVESATGRGTTFRVILPRVGSGEMDAERLAPEAMEDLPAGQGERILVVEDEGAAREGLRDILHSLRYEVVAMGSGEEAGALPSEQPFDVLLTDLMLPGISGWQLAAGLRDRWPSLRVILMSGYPEDEAVRRGIGEGSVRFLQKPFDMARLAHEIQEALAQASEPRRAD